MTSLTPDQSLGVLRDLLDGAHARERVLVRERDIAVDALRQATELLRDLTRASLNRRIEAFLDAEHQRSARW